MLLHHIPASLYQKYSFVVSACNLLILMGVLQLKNRPYIQGENLFSPVSHFVLSYASKLEANTNTRHTVHKNTCTNGLQEALLRQYL